jgi:hypothetical protein
MLTLQLSRKSLTGKAVNGILTIPFSKRPLYKKADYDRDIEIRTLENKDFIIPAGTYPLRMTFSPKFRKNLPLIDQVPDRQGIRIHRGTIPEHSTGCVLVDMYGQSCIEILFNRLKNYYDEKEASICITDDFDARPDSAL